MNVGVGQAAARTRASGVADGDTALVDAMRGGDERALATLYDRHSPAVLWLVLRIVKQRADAESVLMATFLQAWRSAATFDATRGSVLSWLATIARSRALDEVRSTARREARTPLSAAESEQAIDAVAVEHDPLEGVEVCERRAVVDSALATLAPAQRAAIELAYFHGLTHVEIADRLAEPLGTIKTRIRLGMTKLRDLLTPLATEGRS